MALLCAVYVVPGGGALLRFIFARTRKADEVQLMGLRFPNRVGLAAGFDKDARWYNALACLGFGFVEVGTVTPQPQQGNDKPRLFRLPADQALINRMGFNNRGALAAAQRLLHRKEKIVVGVNIGKNKLTPNEEAVDDYLRCFEALYEVADYFVVNVSSPNTPGLRALQDKEPLSRLLRALQQRNKEKIKPKPLLLKIAPDLENEQLDDVVQLVNETGLAGVVATNTTLDRSALRDAVAAEKCGAGGLSGKPLAARSTEVIRYLSQRSGGSFIIIGVGGIHSPADAREKLEAGAHLVQIYTGFIYEGPSLAGRIVKGLRH